MDTQVTDRPAVEPGKPGVEPGARPGIVAETGGARILVVDDEKHIRKVLSLQLQTHGYEVDNAANGVEALERVAIDPPDLILLDVMMPQMDGYEVTRRIRENQRTANIPIIILTARDQLQEKVRGLDHGANDYVTKPFAMTEILLRIRNVLRWSRLQREANPLTGLPGNTAIEQELERRIAAGTPFAFVYADLDNFKAFNDHYGYSRGDQAIRFFARVLTETVQGAGGFGDFVGHVGGDDFVFVTVPERIDAICDQVVSRFDSTVRELYSAEDLERGYIGVTNRRGEEVLSALLTVTLAVVTSEESAMNHIAKISDVASELKSFGKSQPGSIVVKERRR